MRNARWTSLFLAALTLPCPALSAATWTGAGDGWSWSNPDNWEGGALPLGGETVWIKPVAGGGWVDIGGATGGGTITLVIESPMALNLMLNPEARVAGVTTLDPGWHRLGGASPEAASTWQVAPGGSIALDSLAAGSTLLKTGQGMLSIGASASGAGGLRVVGVDGSVVIEAGDPLALSEATLEATSASFSFAGEVARVGKLVIGEGSFGPMAEGRLVADEVVVNRSGYLDLSHFPRIATGVLRIVGGAVRLGGSVETGRIELANATLELGDASLGGLLEVEGGWLDGGVIAGEVAVDAGAGMSGWMGTASVAAGGRLTWRPTEDAAAALWVMGELVFEPGSLLAIAEADWSSPYWDATRTFAFLDRWGNGIVRGMPLLENGLVDGEGSWSVGADGQGGLALTWTADVAPVPEGSALGWAAMLALAAACGRRARRGGRGTLAVAERARRRGGSRSS